MQNYKVTVNQVKTEHNRDTSAKQPFSYYSDQWRDGLAFHLEIYMPMILPQQIIE